MVAVRTFSPIEIGLALAFGMFVEVGFFVMFAIAGDAHIEAEPERVEKERPIAVKPVLDLPLLKKGGKQVKTKLPDMWRKKPPIKRYKKVAAPTPKAEKTKEAIPEEDTPLLKPDAKAPPPDAKLAKEVDEMPETDASPEELNLAEEGAADGVEEGTETDPLKAMAISQYRMRIIRWFASRFKAPDGIPCDELDNLRASVSVQIGPSRSVAGYTMTAPSGNATFDAKVRATMDSVVGGEPLPPPPPKYPDILESTVFTAFLGKNSPRCAN